MSFEAIETEHKSAENHLQVCRLCLSEELLEDIFKYEDLNHWISNLLSIVVSEDDKISRSICALCEARLNEFRDFQLRCLEVQDVLQSGSSTFFENNLPLSEAEEGEPSSEAHCEFTIDTREDLQPKIPDIENQTDDDEKPLVRPNKRNFNTKSGSKHYFYYDKDAYQTQKIKCSTCGEKINKYLIEGHQNRHTGVRPYKCEHGCNHVGFHSRKLQQRHHREVHSRKLYNCDICNKAFRVKQYLNSHKKNVHSSKAFLCSICNVLLASSLGLKRHMQKMHDPNLKGNFPCPRCNLSYNTSGLLHKHLMQMHLVEKNKKGLKKKSVQKYHSLEAPEVKIEPGGDSMKTKDELQDDSYAAAAGNLCWFEVEEAKIDPELNPEHGQDDSSSAVEEDISLLESDKPEIFDKNICHMSHPSKARLRSHQSNVYSVKKYVCSLCDIEPFPTIYRLKLHMRVHDRDDNYS